MLDGVQELTTKLTEEGIKVSTTVEDDVYVKLFATIVAAVTVAAIGFYLVQAVFKKS